jgi:hypothetical protein
VKEGDALFIGAFNSDIHAVTKIQENFEMEWPKSVSCMTNVNSVGKHLNVVRNNMELLL